ncbi:MAG: hypothetical protein JSU01_10110, partial [Bacteroidetes bacterium]|nr:hypothetical protein [Bacteroidota bacterium]
MKKLTAGVAGFLLLLIGTASQRADAQAEFRPWGNLEGIRVKGQLMEFNSRIVVVGDNWNKAKFTGKEMQRPKYSRTSEEQQEVSTMIDSLQFTETMKNTGRGSAEIILKCVPHADARVEGIYFNVSLPLSLYANSKFSYAGNESAFPNPDQGGEYWHGDAKELRFTSQSQSIQVEADTTSAVFARSDTSKRQKYIRLYFPICSGELHHGQVFQSTYEIKVSGDIDESPVSLKLDASVQGRPFAGLGGNFRIQNPKVDPEVIDYCL